MGTDLSIHWKSHIFELGAVFQIRTRIRSIRTRIILHIRSSYIFYTHFLRHNRTWNIRIWYVKLFIDCLSILVTPFFRSKRRLHKRFFGSSHFPSFGKISLLHLYVSRAYTTANDRCNQNTNGTEPNANGRK